MKREETMDRTTLQRVKEKLLTAQQEIDELALQLALGKADAKDKFEEIKKEFGLHVSELRILLESAAEKSVSPGVRAKIEELEVQLALGKADSKELFETQKKKIVGALTDLEGEIKKSWQKMRSPDFFTHEAAQFKLKLEIIRLRFGLKKFEMREDYRLKMAEVRRDIKNMTSSTKDRLSKSKEKYHDFKDEVSLAYKHIKKAVESLT